MPKTSKLSFEERKKGRMYANADEWQGKLAGALVMLVMCAQPLFVDWYGYINLTGHKFVFFVTYMVCILVGVVTIWIYRITRTPRLLPRDMPTIVDWAVIVFAAVTLISAIFSPFRHETNVWTGIPEPEGRYDGAITQLLYVTIYFIVSRWYSPKTRHFTIVGISTVIIALIGILQFYGMDFLGLWPNYDPNYRVPNFYNIYFRSTLGNVNIVSTYVCVAILLCGFLFIRYTPPPVAAGGRKSLKSFRQPLWLAASALCFWLMDLAGSDSGLVGVAVTFFLAMPFIIENRRVLGRALILAASWLAVFILQRLFYEVLILDARTFESLLSIIAAVVLLLAAGVFLTKWGKDPDEAPDGTDTPVKWKLGVILIIACIVAGLLGVEILGRRELGAGFAGRLISEAREVLHGNLRDEMGSGRIHIWKNALKAFPNHPIIGSGPDTFRQAFPEEAQGFMNAGYDKAHNEYLQILVCQGILGLLSYLVFLAGVLIKSVSKAFRNPLVMAVLAAFVGYCVQAVFNISLPIASQMLWVFAGLLACNKFRDTPFQELV